MTDQATEPTTPAADAEPTDDPRGSQVPGGPAVPESAELQTDDFATTGTLTDQVARALEDRWGNTGTLTPDADTSTTDSATADAATQPDPTTPATPGSEPGDVGGSGVGGDALEGAAPVEGAPPAPGSDAATAASELDLNEYARDYFGTNLTPEQARELFSVFGGISALTPEKRAHLDAILSGGGQLPPSSYVTGQQPPVVQQDPMAQPWPQTGPAAYQPAPQPGPVQRPSDDDPEGQHYFDQFIAPLAQQQAALQADIARTTQAQLQQEQQRNAAEIGNAASTWRAAHADLTDAEWARVEDNVVRSGILPSLVQVHGSFTAATTAALEQTFWADPQLRERAFANRMSGRVEGNGAAVDATSAVTQQQASDDAQRQARASSVSGGGGAPVSREPSSAIPKDPDARRKVLLAELEAGMNG